MNPYYTEYDLTTNYIPSMLHMTHTPSLSPYAHHIRCPADFRGQAALDRLVLYGVPLYY